MYTFWGNDTKFLFIYTGNSGSEVLDSGRKYVANVLLRQLVIHSFMNYGSVMNEVFLVVCTLYSKKREKPKANMQLNTTKVTLIQYPFMNSILHFPTVKSPIASKILCTKSTCTNSQKVCI